MLTPDARSASTDNQPRQALAGDQAFEYRVVRSRRRRKTVQIEVRNGEVVVTAPCHVANQELADIVARRADWILSRLPAGEPKTEQPGLTTGSLMPYRGRRLTLAVALTDSVAAEGRVSLWEDRLQISVPAGLSEAECRQRVGQAATGWYCRQTERLIRADLRRWWPALGVDRDGYPPIHIRNQRKRWGSCASDGSLRFNWRLSMLEPALLEYVVVHELAHLTHMNHSARFWELVARHLPDVKERQQRLKEAEKTLPPL